MTAMFGNRDKILCLHCNNEQDGFAENYVVSWKSGAASRCEEICHYCDEVFVAQRINKEEIMVTFNDIE